MSLEEEQIERCFIQSVTGHINKDEIDAYLEVFMWVPKEIIEVSKLSDEVFEMAKDAYFSMEDADEKSKRSAVQKLNKIKQLGEKLKHIEYKYGANKNKILADYEYILSESTLDVNTVKGDDFIQSITLGEFIKEIETKVELNLIDPPNFDDFNPFKIESSIFEELKQDRGDSKNE